LLGLFCQSSDWRPVNGPPVGHKEILDVGEGLIDNSAILSIGGRIGEIARGFHWQCSVFRYREHWMRRQEPISCCTSGTTYLFLALFTNSELLSLSPMLKPQDILIACKLFTLGDAEWPMRRLAGSLSISLGEIHAAVERGRAAGVLGLPRGRLNVARRKFFDLVSVAVPQVYYAVRGSVEIGVPAAMHAEPLKGVFPRDGRPVPLVWPCERGTVRGESLLPLYLTVPGAVENDPDLHRLLALIDVVRVGDAKDRRLATDLLERLILGDGRRQEI